MLAPRTASETFQAFISLGALSPHNTAQLHFRSLARDPSKRLDIECIFELSAAEIATLDSLTPFFANNIVKVGMGAAGNFGPTGLIQFLSSPDGTQALKRAREQVEIDLPAIKANGKVTLHLIIEPATGIIRGTRQLDQIIFSTFEGSLPGNKTIFSYFPADRSIPAGDVPIQIGGPDFAAQLESHNSQPQAKFNRLKPTIINQYLLNLESRTGLSEDFCNMFSKVLKNRSLVGIEVNDLGLVSIRIKEDNTGRTFDIDGMSSGEKGLILTFLLISHSIAKGGIILLDEPELHLNPAVCKLILPFLIEEYLIPNDVQAIICSHSPEVLGSAFESPNCTLLHLQSPNIISPIYEQDKKEVFDALRRLGASTGDVLFSAGNIFVEGEHDKEILESGYDRLLAKYNVTQLGGRASVEKEISEIQAAEREGRLDTLKCFIFDLDAAPTPLSSTKLVKVLRWKRHCLENYLIDEKIIYELLRDQEVSNERIEKRGEVQNIFKELAMSQLGELVAKDVYERLKYENSGLRKREIKGKSFKETAEILFARLASIKNQICSLDENTWLIDFEKACSEENEKKLAEWETEWPSQCDGKRFFNDLHRRFRLKLSPLKFKKLIVEKMKYQKTETWVVLEHLLKEALAV